MFECNRLVWLAVRVESRLTGVPFLALKCKMVKAGTCFVVWLVELVYTGSPLY